MWYCIAIAWCSDQPFAPSAFDLFERLEVEDSNSDFDTRGPDENSSLYSDETSIVGDLDQIMEIEWNLYRKDPVSEADVYLTLALNKDL